MGSRWSARRLIRGSAVVLAWAGAAAGATFSAGAGASAPSAPASRVHQAAPSPKAASHHSDATSPAAGSNPRDPSGHAVAASVATACLPKPQNPKVTNQSVTFPFASSGVTTGRIRQTSPVVVTVAVGGTPETIVVFGDENGVVHVVDTSTCQELPGWPQQMAVPRGSPAGAHAVIESTPAIGWLDGPNQPPTIVVGSGSTWDNTGIGEVEAFYLNGYERWLRVVRATPGNANGVFSSPAIGDVGGGGQQDVVFGSWDYHLYVVDKTGRSLPGTPYYNAETIWSSPALFQMPGRHTDDVFIGLDKTQTDKPHGCIGGFVADLRYGIVPGARHRGLYVVHESSCQGTGAHQRVGQAVWSSPAVGYLSTPAAAAHVVANLAGGTSRRGVTTDPVVAIGTSWYDQPFGSGTNRLYVYDATTMHLLWRGTTDGPIYGSPAIGVLSGPHRPAIVDTSFVCTQPVALDRLSNCLSTQLSEVDAWSATGSLLWSTKLIGPTDLGSPVLVPLLGEKADDVLVGSSDGLYPLSGANGSFLYGTSTIGPQRAVHPGCRLFNTPAVADVQGPGSYRGWYAFELCSDGVETSGGLYAFPLPKAPAAPPAWPMFRANPSHTGVAASTMPGWPAISGTDGSGSASPLASA